jgi:hypothetical protein
MILEVLQHILQPKSGPDAFFTFFSKEGVREFLSFPSSILIFFSKGFTVPMTEREVGHAHGYTFAACIHENFLLFFFLLSPFIVFY